jgi:hypothetical protein
MSAATIPGSTSTQAPVQLRSPALDGLSRRLEDPNCSGFDLVWLAMVAMYMTTENNLRSQVEDMRDSLEEMEFYRNLQRQLRDASATGNAQSTLFSGSEYEALASEPLYAADGTTEIGKSIDLGDGYILTVYTEDNPDTVGFNELTGETCAVDDEGNADGQEMYANATIEDKKVTWAGSPATFRAVISKDGYDVAEIMSCEDEDGKMQTYMSTLSYESSTFERDASNGSYYDAQAVCGTDGKQYRRNINGDGSMKPISDSEGFELQLGDTSLEIGVTKGQVSGMAILQEGAPIGLELSFDNASGSTITGSSMSEETIAADDLDEAYVSKMTYKLLEGGGPDDTDGKQVGFQETPDDYQEKAKADLGDSNDGIHGDNMYMVLDEGTDNKDVGDSVKQNESTAAYAKSESVLSELGFNDENGDGNLYDDFFKWAEAELGYKIDPSKGLTAGDGGDLTLMADACQDKIDSLNSLNQIDMLYLEKSFNMLNVIVTALSNIESGHNRALMTIANNLA